MHFPQIHGVLSVKGSPSGRGAQPLRHCFAMPPPLPRGGLGSPRKVNGSARGSPTRGNGDDRRQWRRSSPLLPKGEALARPEGTKNPRGGRNSLGDFSLLEMKALGSHISVFIICDSPQRSSTAQKVYSHSSLWHLLYLFVKVYDIMSLRLVPPNLPRMGEGGCCLMAYIFSFVLSVAANVASYYICKWLDGWLKGRKH